MESDSPFQKRKQSDIFLQTEGDNWFARNQEALSSSINTVSTNLIINRIGKFKPTISSILEVGCANAIKLELLTTFFEAKAFGVDPSIAAITDARNRFSGKGIPNEFWVGESSVIPLKDDSIDLVFLGFFLYLIPSQDLHITLTEINRVLKPGGFLAVEDFDPGEKYSKPYAHHQDVVTYKDEYSRYFTNEYKYFLLEKISYSHSSDTFDLDADERLSTQLFYKPQTS